MKQNLALGFLIIVTLSGCNISYPNNEQEYCADMIVDDVDNLLADKSIPNSEKINQLSNHLKDKRNKEYEVFLSKTLECFSNKTGAEKASEKKPFNRKSCGYSEFDFMIDVSPVNNK